VLAALLVVLAPVAPSGAAKERPTFALGTGEGRVWSGPFVRSASGSGCAAGNNCWTYALELEGGGLRLRVGIDHPDHHDEFALELHDPTGRTVASRSHTFLETPEIIVGEPAKGVWELAVIAQDVEASSFTLRAKLEDEVPGPQPGRMAPPNLRAEPGFDFSFAAPLGSNYLGGAPTPASVSCHPDEVVEDLVVRCLRFSFGYQNAGAGPLDLHFDPLTDAASTTTNVTQRVYVGDGSAADYSDNRFDEHAAGTATYHEVHGHFHYDAVFQAHVLRVTDRDRGETEEIGAAAKRGACAHDWVLVDFERFYQDTAGTADSGSDCNFGFTNPTSTDMRIGLSRGWADIYTAELSDNYVSFGAGDGLYLVRVWADPDDHIVETNERDNVAYSLIRVQGDTVELLERARGTSPWDPDRVVLRGLGD
jgi:hypothetical protein